LKAQPTNYDIPGLLSWLLIWENFFSPHPKASQAPLNFQKCVYVCSDYIYIFVNFVSTVWPMVRMFLADWWSDWLIFVEVFLLSDESVGCIAQIYIIIHSILICITRFSLSTKFLSFVVDGDNEVFIICIHKWGFF
jgi:hypothetical protein